VSDRHCRLTLAGDEFQLQDLGSEHGTFVNSKRIATPTKVSRRDAITLGTDVPMAWPTDALRPGSRVLTIGRLPDNELVVDLPIVSGHHARAIWEPSTRDAFIEDLGSSNGTSIGGPLPKVTQALLVPGTVIYLGTHPIAATDLLARLDTSSLPSYSIASRELVFGRDPACDCVIAVPSVSGRHARIGRLAGRLFVEDLGSANGTSVNGQRIAERTRIEPGDVIALGMYTFTVNDTERAPATVVLERPTLAEAQTADQTVQLTAPPVAFDPEVPVARSITFGTKTALLCAALVSIPIVVLIVLLMRRGVESIPTQADAPLPPGPARSVDFVTSTSPAPSLPAPAARSTPSESIAPPAEANLADLPQSEVRQSKAGARPKRDAGPTRPMRASGPDLELPGTYRPVPDSVSWANGLDLAHLSVEDEQRLGAELHSIIIGQQAKLKNDSRSTDAENDEILKRVEEIAAPLIEARSRKQLRYKFTILDSDEVNAFSIPGGYIYICRGLFNLIGGDEDAALEFVLGHEIAHVDQGHLVACIASGNADAKKKGIDTLQQCFVPIVFGYPDRVELEADAWVLSQMKSRLQRSRYESMAFLRRFEGFARDKGFADGRRFPEPGTNILDNHFRAQPSARDRRKHAESLFSGPGSPAQPR
jgi:pSer/pThr/pTyr-binding forkhead associated (FHA) protein